MTLSLVGKSILQHTSASGVTTVLDLDKVVANFDGTLALTGNSSGRFSKSASRVRLQGVNLVADLTKADKTTVRDASIDLEAVGVVTENGAAIPEYLNDPVCQTMLPFGHRSALALGVPTKRLRKAIHSYSRNKSCLSAMRMANASEQRALYFLAMAEREVLRVAGKKCFSARIAPGWVHGDENLWLDPRLDRHGYARDFRSLVRLDANFSPPDYASCFELAVAILLEETVTFGYEDDQLPAFFRVHARDALSHLSRSMTVRLDQQKRDAAFNGGSASTVARRRMCFNNRLGAVITRLSNIVEVHQPKIKLTVPKERRSNSTSTSSSTSKSSACRTESSSRAGTSVTTLMDEGDIDDANDYDLDDSPRK